MRLPVQWHQQARVRKSLRYHCILDRPQCEHIAEQIGVVDVVDEHFQLRVIAEFHDGLSSSDAYGGSLFSSKQLQCRSPRFDLTDADPDGSPLAGRRVFRFCSS